MKRTYTSFFALSLSLINLTAFAQTNDSLHYTGSIQKWVVPGCVTSVTLQVYGAQGSNGLGPNTRTFPTASAGGAGGFGGEAIGVLAVTPGDTLYVYVGGQTGWNGGGDTGTGYGLEGGFGGGASDVRYHGTTLADRVIVAGGGGGGGAGGSNSLCGPGTPGPGGAGGTGGIGTGGDTGTESCNGSCPTQGDGGKGGTLIAGGIGGSGGTGLYTGINGFNGTLGIGGQAGGTNYPSPPYWVDATGIGGGGGGGYYGGGGGGGAGFAGGCGAPGGGGGGGSSYIGGVTAGITNAGVNNGNGYVLILNPCITTGINTLYTKNAARVFPNPNNGEFSVVLENTPQSKCEIYVYDVLNSMVYQAKLNSKSTKISLINRSVGVYFYKIISDDGKLMSTGKLMVQ